MNRLIKIFLYCYFLSSSLFAQNTEKVQEIIKAQAEQTKANAMMLTAQSSYLKAQSDMLKAQVDALESLQKIKSAQLDNELKTAKTFYDKRTIREVYNLSKNIPTSQQSKNEPPKGSIQLSSYSPLSINREIKWPVIFQLKEFEGPRNQMNLLFKNRDMLDVGPTTLFYRNVMVLCNQLMVILRSNISKISHTESIAATKFVNSLIVEANTPMNLKNVAIR